MAVTQTAAMPYALSGYFDTVADANFNYQVGKNDRRRAFDQMLLDYGMVEKTGPNGNTRLAFDRTNPTGAYMGAVRDTAYNVADRGFGIDSSMRRIAMRPTINELTKQAARASSDLTYENERAAKDRRRVIQSAARNAARWGTVNEAFLPPKM